MSIKLMNAAWDSDLATGPKMVLLSMCDQANDEGVCWPSIETVEKRCSMSRRSVFSHIATLEEMGACVRVVRPGKATVYQLDPCKFCTGANSARVQELHPTRANSALPHIENHQGTTNGVFRAREVLLGMGVSQQAADDWLKHRARKKAIVTQRVIDSIAEKARSAGMGLQEALEASVERGWTGFDPTWLQDRKAAPGAAKSFREQDREARMARWEQMTGDRHPERGVVDVVASTGAIQ